MSSTLRLISAGPVTVLPPDPPSLWARILTFLHLPGGIVAPQPPTITSCEFTGEGAPGPYPPGAPMQITVIAQSLNTTTVNYTVPVVVADPTAEVSNDANANGQLEAFNQLIGSISDPTGRKWTVISTSQTAPGVFTGVLGSTA